MKNFISGSALASALVAAAALPSAAIAQDGSMAEESAAEPNAGDIIVTAQRRSENAQRVPIAITAATAESLEAAAITTTMQLTTISPGLNVRSGPGSFTAFIRGIGTSSNLVESPVAFFVDGVYYPQQRDSLRDLYDIEQVAILKGPQGTLFGRNATGGMIQITTKKPSFTFGGEAGASIDNYATLNTHAYVTGPLAGKVAFSLSGQYSKQFDGYGTNVTTGHDTYKLRSLASVRGKLLFEPSDLTTVTLIGDYQDRKTRSTSYQVLPGTQFSISGSPPLSNRYDTRAGGDDHANFRGGGVSLSIEQDLGFAKLLSISAYRDGKGSAHFYPFPNPAVSFQVEYRNSPSTMYSQEIQLLSNPGPFKWVAGAYYFNYSNSNLPTIVDFAPPFTNFSPDQIDNYGKEKTESIAPFGQFDWQLLENTTLTGGVRWTYEKRIADLRKIVTLANGVVLPATVRNDSTTFREPTFRLALSQQFTPTIMGYVSFNTGFKSGGYNIVNVDNAAYAPEKLKAYEVGFKSQFLDRRVRINAAAYYYDYKNLQIARFINGTQFVQNGAAAELYGLDVDIEAQVTSELTVRASAAIEHTAFTDFPNADLIYPQPNGSNLFVPGSAKGRRLPLAQEMSGTLAVDYHRDFAAGAIDANVTANYSGDYFFEAGGGLLRQDPYVMLNATLKYTLPGDRISFSVFGKNLLDEAILVYPNTQTFGYNANYAPPRTYGIAARIRF